MEKQKRYRIAGACFLPWSVLLILLRTMDRAAIGPAGEKVGLSRLNRTAAALLGWNPFWYRLSQGLGWAALGVMAVFLALAVVQLVRRRSLMDVDEKLQLLAGLYAAVPAFYLVFRLVTVNRAPVLLPGRTLPASSFPAIHTVLVCTAFGSAILLVGDYIRSEKLCFALRLGCALAMIAAVCSRLLSGVCWITDLLGGYLLGGMLLALYSAWISN